MNIVPIFICHILTIPEISSHKPKYSYNVHISISECVEEQSTEVRRHVYNVPADYTP